MRWPVYVRKKNPSQGSPFGNDSFSEWWQRVIVRDRFFYPILTHNDFFYITFYYIWKIWTNFQKFLNTLRCDIHMTWWRYFNITMTSRIDLQPAFGWRTAARFICFAPVGTGFVGNKNTSWVWGWDRKIRPDDQRLALRDSLCRMGIPCKFCDDFWRPIPK